MAKLYYPAVRIYPLLVAAASRIDVERRGHCAMPSDLPKNENDECATYDGPDDL